MKPILLVISNPEWTHKAMHLACQLANNTKSPLVLLDFRLTHNVGGLGQGAYQHPNYQEHFALRDYHLIAEEYGLEVTIQPVEYESFHDVMIQIVDEFDGTVVFAQPPKSIIPFWSQFTLWQLQHELAKMNCRLYTLENERDTAETWLPKIKAFMNK